MDKVVILITIFYAINSIANATDKLLPQKFLGTFSQESAENLDDYLAAKGIGWVTRRLINLAKFTKSFKQAKSGTTGRYDFEYYTSKTRVDYSDWELGKQFQNESLDGIQRYITFDIDESGNVLTEKHIKVDDTTEVEIYEYSIDDDNKMKEKLSYQGIQAERLYVR